METNEKKGKDLVVEDGHPASFRNADGSMKNIYSDDGNLTEEGKTIILLRETLSKKTHESEKADNTSKRKRKLIIWGVSAGVIVFFCLFFHIYISTGGGIDIFAKSVPTFSNTFITAHDVDDVLKRYNNASIFEQLAMQNEPFVKLLFEKGILYNESGEKEKAEVNLKSLEELVNNGQQGQESLNEQTEYYNYYYYGESGGVWEAFKVKIIFGKKEIKVVTAEETNTFIIVGSPEKEKTLGGGFNTKYNVYYSKDADKDIRQIMRYEDQTIIVHVSESGEYEIFSKNETF